MLSKIFIFLLALTGNLLITWYGYFTGRLPSKGVLFGFFYDSITVRALITQFQYVWVLIIINFIFSLMFHLGFRSLPFLPLAIIWMGSGPLALLIFDGLILKERVDVLSLVGVVLVFLGGVCVVGHKEILALFN